MRTSLLGASILGVALSLSSGASLAAPGWSNTTSLSNRQLSVIDLTPNDGQAAGFSLLSHEAYISASSSPPGESPRWVSRPLARGESASIGLTHNALQLNGSAQGSLGNPSLSLTSGTPLVPYSWTSLRYAQYTKITLQPHSVLLLTGTAAAQMLQPDANVLIQNSVGATFYVGVYDSYSAYSLDFWSLNKPQWQAREDFSISYANFSDSSQVISMKIENVIDIQPVPEPGTWAMLGGGLLLLGAWTRRQRTALPQS